jgi:hypothetical protein
MSSFIERFSILGTAGVLGLMVVGGIYGFASLLGVEPDEPLRSLARSEVEEVADSDGPARSGPAQVVRQEASPTAQPGEGPSATPTPRPTPQPSDAPPAQVLSLARDEARPGGGPAAPPAATPGPAPLPTAVATPGPAPHTPPPTPGPPTPAPDPPTPTPPPAECSAGGAPQLQENGNHVGFAYGAVVLVEGGLPGVLVVDVGGTLVSLLITDGTEVRGQLGAATLVSGEGRRGTDGNIVATFVEVLCPDWAR